MNILMRAWMWNKQATALLLLQQALNTFPITVSMSQHNITIYIIKLL